MQIVNAVLTRIERRQDQIATSHWNRIQFVQVPIIRKSIRQLLLELLEVPSLNGTRIHETAVDHSHEVLKKHEFGQRLPVGQHRVGERLLIARGIYRQLSQFSSQGCLQACWGVCDRQ